MPTLQVMLVARVLWQPGVPAAVRPPTAWQPVLEQLGLWRPSVSGGMLAVAATLLLVRDLFFGPLESAAEVLCHHLSQ